MEAVVAEIQNRVEFVMAVPAAEEDIARVHDRLHIDSVRREGLFNISALAAGGAIQTAMFGLDQPSFGLLRPPGHHASAGSAWGFCYFNNMAIAIEALKAHKNIQTAFVLDIDLHFGDGTANTLGNKPYVSVYNVEALQRDTYLAEVARELDRCQADVIGISAGFDHHRDDWGGLLLTEDYYEIGKMVKMAARRCAGGCFGILEGGYNHRVLGVNVRALIEGLGGDER
jgi:acetoin utilization deacetylase AcuC-like enzyme